MNNEIIYSVAAAYEHDGRLWYYRLADINPTEMKLVEANYNTNDNEYIHEPVSLYVKGDKELFKTVIIKWKHDLEDDRLQIIEKNDLDVQIFEVVFLEENIENMNYDEKYVRDRLFSGFHVDDSVNNEFLLVVGKNSGFLNVLRCDRKMFESKIDQTEKIGTELFVNRNNRDLLRSVSSLEIFSIDKNSIVCLDNLLQHNFAKSAGITARYFYEEFELRRNIGMLLVRDMQDLEVYYLSKYFKDVKSIFDITNRERTKFISVINALNVSEETLSEFANKTGYSRNQIKVSLSNLGKEIIESLDDNEQMIKILREILLKDEKYHLYCLNKIKDEWEKSEVYIFEKTKRERELLKLANELELTNNEIEHNLKELDELKNMKNIIVEENNKQSIKLKELKNKIDISLETYKKDILQIVKDQNILEISQTSKVDTIDKKGYIHWKNKEISSNELYYFEETESYESLIDNMIDNFNLFYEDERAIELAASTITAIVNSKGIIIDESIGEIFSRCISILVDRKLVDRYIFNDINIDVNRLCKSISSNSNTIIYLDGLMNNYNENVMKILIKLFPSKRFIFGIDSENLLTLSKGVWKYAIYIDVNSKYCGKSKSKYIASKYNINGLKKEMSMVESTIKDRQIKKYTLLNDSQKFDMINILDYYSKAINCNEIPIFYLDQIALNSTKSIEIICESLTQLYSENLVKNTMKISMMD